MKFIDIHTHQKKQNNDTIHIYNCIVKNEMSKLEKKINFSAGIHPWFLDDFNEKFKKLIKFSKEKNCIAIGECGLDYQKKYLEKFSKKKQIEYFEKQILLAEKTKKPLIVHSVKSIDDVIKIKKENNSFVPWIIHGFTKNKQTAKQLIDNGFYLSFGTKLFSNIKNQEALKSIPINRILLETDDSHTDIKDLYKFVAKLIGINISDLVNQIYNNFNLIFNFTSKYTRQTH